MYKRLITYARLLSSSPTSRKTTKKARSIADFNGAPAARREPMRLYGQVIKHEPTPEILIPNGSYAATRRCNKDVTLLSWQNPQQRSSFHTPSRQGSLLVIEYSMKWYAQPAIGIPVRSRKNYGLPHRQSWGKPTTVYGISQSKALC